MRFFLLLLGILLLVNSCYQDKSPVTVYKKERPVICDSVPKEIPEYVSRRNFFWIDRDFLEIVPGVFLICRGVSEKYYLDKVIRGKIVLKNVSSDTPFEGVAPGKPFYSVYVEDRMGNLLDYYPKQTDSVAFHFSLKKGDSLVQYFAWPQVEFVYPYRDTHSMIKTYAYEHFMYISMQGNDTLATHWIRKKIVIVSKGNYFSTCLARNLFYPDCWVYDFFVRNRSRTDSVLQLVQPFPLELRWYKGGRLIQVKRFPLDSSQIYLPALSTRRFRFPLLRDDPVFQELPPAPYDLVAVLKTTGAIFADTSSFTFR